MNNTMDLRNQKSLNSVHPKIWFLFDLEFCPEAQCRYAWSVDITFIKIATKRSNNSLK